MPLFTAPGSVAVPVLLAPAAVPAPDVLASPAAAGLLAPVVPIFVCVDASPCGLPVGLVVFPFMDPLEVLPLAAGPPDEELPPAEFCAIANELESASAVANAIVVSFMVVSSLVFDERQPLK